MKVKLSVDGAETEVEVAPTHATVETVLAAARKKLKKGWRLFVGSTPADLSTAVSEGQQVSMTPPVRGS